MLRIIWFSFPLFDVTFYTSIKWTYRTRRSHNWETKLRSRETKLRSGRTKLRSMESKLPSRETKLRSMESKLPSRETKLRSMESKLRNRESKLERKGGSLGTSPFIVQRLAYQFWQAKHCPEDLFSDHFYPERQPSGRYRFRLPTYAQPGAAGNHHHGRFVL